MKRFPKHAASLLVASSLATLVACGGSSDNTTAGGSDTGRLSLAVTDAPVDSANHVFVEFSGVTIQPVDGERIEFTFDEAKSIDLLALQGSASEALLTDEEVPAGDYEWIRLHVNAEHDGMLDSYVELNDGNQVELRVPSGDQTGLKLVSGFTVAAGGSSDFTIDFDLRKSVILPPGQAGAFLRPALRLLDNQAVGSIAGTVNETLVSEHCANSDASAGAVYVYSGADVAPVDVTGDESDPLITALVDFEDGAYRYEAGFLSEGDYTVAYTCDAIDDEAEVDDSLTFVGPATVAVIADEETEHNFEAGAEVVTDGNGAEEGEEGEEGKEEEEEEAPAEA